MTFEIPQEEVTRLQKWCTATLEKLNSKSQETAGFETVCGGKDRGKSMWYFPRNCAHIDLNLCGTFPEIVLILT